MLIIGAEAVLTSCINSINQEIINPNHNGNNNNNIYPGNPLALAVFSEALQIIIYKIKINITIKNWLKS